MLLKWTNVTTEPGMAWVRRMRSSRCLFTVCTITERLTSSGMTKSQNSFFFFFYFFVLNDYFNAAMHFCRPNDSRMLVALGESYEKLAQQVEAKKVWDNSK